MHISFSLNEAKSREYKLAYDFANGIKSHGDTFDTIGYDQGIPAHTDLICLIGVKSMWRIQECINAGKQFLYFDKGYNRKEGYWRIAINAHQPTDYLMGWSFPDDRRKKFKWKPKPWRTGGSILFAGSSAKFHEFKGLVNPTKYAIERINEIREYTKTRLLYRPKPSWRDARPIPGTVYSKEKSIHDVLSEVGLLVTYGSNSCFEALLYGIPAIVLGDGITRDISSQKINDIAKPFRAPEEKVLHLLNQLAYCQFTPDEMQSGKAWEIIKCQITG